MEAAPLGPEGGGLASAFGVTRPSVSVTSGDTLDLASGLVTTDVVTSEDPGASTLSHEVCITLFSFSAGPGPEASARGPGREHRYPLGEQLRPPPGRPVQH